MAARISRIALLLSLAMVVQLLSGPLLTHSGPECPDGFEGLAGSCYNTSRSEVSWEEARNHCVSLGSHLPYIGNEAEANALKAELGREGGPVSPFWVGLVRLTEEDGEIERFWEDGSRVTLDCGPFVENIHCMAFSNGKLTAYECGSSKRRICEAAEGRQGEGTTTGTAPSNANDVTDAAHLGPVGSTIGIAAQPWPPEGGRETVESNSSPSQHYVKSLIEHNPASGIREELKTSEGSRGATGSHFSHSLEYLKGLIAEDPSNEEQLKEVLEICARLLERDPLGPTGGRSQEEAVRVIEVIEFLDETFSLVLASLHRNRTSLSVFTRVIVFEAFAFDGLCGDVRVRSDHGIHHEVSLCTTNDQGGHIGVGITCVPYEDITFSLGNGTRKRDSMLGSCVVTMNAAQSGIAPSAVGTVDAVTMAIARTETWQDREEAQVCAFWSQGTNVTNGTWSEEGCHVTGSNASHVICSCNHLTNFAVLVQFDPMAEPISEKHRRILDVMTRVGGAFSIVCLSATLVLYASLKLLGSPTHIIHANLAVSILVSQLLFLSGIEATENKEVCKLVAALLHYTLLSSFSWMAIEGAHLHHKATSIQHRSFHTGLIIAIGWATPLPVVGISLSVKFSSYLSKDCCWLNTNDGLLWSFVGPVVLVILGNTCILLNLIRVLLSLEVMTDKSRMKRITAGARAVVLLTPLLGITWLVGLFNVPGAQLAVSYVFVILNPLQGVLIFLLHCVFNEEVKKAFQVMRNRHRRQRSNKIHPNKSDQQQERTTTQTNVSNMTKSAWACTPEKSRSSAVYS